MLISLIVPCYNEEEAMPLFYQEAARVAAQMEKSHGAEFEIIFVDDGSKDGTLRVARELHDADPRVRYVSFSRNFGKEAGIYAGLKAAKGDYVATLDADLQDPPALLPDMLDALLTGDYDCAATRRTTREGEPPVRSWFARMFYRIINKMSDTEIVDGARDFRLMSRRMVDAVLEMSEYNRFSKGIFSWVGFKTKWFAYQNVERVAGQTKWNFWSLFKYSIEGIVGFSTQPLVMAALAGVIFCLAAFVGIIFVVVRALIFGDPTAGWPSMVCIMLLCSGVQLFCQALKPQMEERSEVMHQYEKINGLYQLLSGNRKNSRMDIETYVQRHYLEQILEAANQRFQDMSAGQFELRMCDIDKAGTGKNRGLDLMVYSAVTGKVREVRTLSGGESFMAALSLALGMADQIQESSAAINLDMMFIDEGFGSLDEHSRDQAVKVLQNMAEGEKLIGIISHVTELKQEIEDQLIVTKDDQGSHTRWQIS